RRRCPGERAHRARCAHFGARTLQHGEQRLSRPARDLLATGARKERRSAARGRRAHVGHGGASGGWQRLRCRAGLARGPAPGAGARRQYEHKRLTDQVRAALDCGRWRSNCAGGTNREIAAATMPEDPNLDTPSGIKGRLRSGPYQAGRLCTYPHIRRTQGIAVARRSVYVTDAMKKGMDAVGDRVNWSEAAQTAFDREIVAATMPEDPNLDQVIERLLASKADFDLYHLRPVR